MRYNQSNNCEFNDVVDALQRRLSQLCIENSELKQKTADLEIQNAELKQDKADLVTVNAELRGELESVYKELGKAKQSHDAGGTIDLQHILNLGSEVANFKRKAYGRSSEKVKKKSGSKEKKIKDAKVDDAGGGGSAKAKKAKKKPNGPPPARRSEFPKEFPREAKTVESEQCPHCDSTDIVKNGNHRVSQMIDIVSRSFKVMQRFTCSYYCKNCKRTHRPKVHQLIKKAMVGSVFLATVIHDRFFLHIPYNRQSKQMEQEGLDMPVSTLCGQIKKLVPILQPLLDLIIEHTLAGPRVFADETPMPIMKLAEDGGAKNGYVWLTKRDDRPFGGMDPPSVYYTVSKGRGQEIPAEIFAEFSGIVQTDAYAGYNILFDEDRRADPCDQSLCWAHARRYFYLETSWAFQKRRKNKSSKFKPYAKEAEQTVLKIDQIFELERSINGLSPEERLSFRKIHIEPLVMELEQWLKQLQEEVPKKSAMGGAINYVLSRLNGFKAFLHDGRMCLSNNLAEQHIRPVAMGRNSWLFFGSLEGGETSAMMMSLVNTCLLNGVYPLHWLIYVFERINYTPKDELHVLLPWNCKDEVKQFVQNQKKVESENQCNDEAN